LEAAVKIVPFSPTGWVKDHPMGTISFQHLLKGDPGSRSNFMLILGRQDADFWMPRHRHNFDQIRFPLRGSMNHGDFDIPQGQVGYVPEGLPYGPQCDPLAPFASGERLQLVLQFGGASGCGFMSIEQRREALEALKKTGTMDGPYYRRNDGTTEWALNAVWKHVFGEAIKYPRPRYQNITIADPQRFNWLPVRGAAGVERKFMGAFSERAVGIELVRVAGGTTWTSQDADALRLLFVLDGAGTIAETTIVRYAAIQADAGERLALAALAELTLFVITLPPVDVPALASEEFDAEELLEEAVPA
jgi:hypothetical protein